MQAIEKNSKKLDRIKNRSGFLSVQKSGEKWIGKTLILQIKLNGSEKSRVGFTITKKIYPLAVDRNRVKRRLRAISQEILPTMGKSGVDYVLIGRKESLTAPFDVIKKELIWCLKRLDLLRDN